MEPGAEAQSDQERAGARAAATQGAEAFDAGNYQDAISYFERAQALVKALPHLLFIARSHEKLGNLVEARENYNKIVRERLKPTDPEAFRQAQETADEELQKLEPRVPTITINITGPGANEATVSMDGKALSSALIGVPMPINPGEHKFDVKAPGALPASQSVTISEGGKEVIQLELQPGSTGASTSSGEAAVGGDVTADQGAPAGSLRVPAYIALGVGAVGVGLGTIFLISGFGDQSDADEKFDACAAAAADGVCRDPAEKSEIEELDKSAASSKTLGVVGLVVGGAALTTGIILLAVDGSGSAETAQKGVRPVIGLGYAGIAGRF
jgi:tetratricopeptide (TPR) repeat protein